MIRLPSLLRRIFARKPVRDSSGRYSTHREYRAIIRNARLMRKAFPGRKWKHVL